MRNRTRAETGRKNNNPRKLKFTNHKNKSRRKNYTKWKKSKEWKEKFKKIFFLNVERPKSMKSVSYLGKIRKIFQNNQNRPRPQPVFIYLSFFSKSYSAYQGEAQREQSKPKQIRLMDRTVGRLTEILKNERVFNNCVIFFISDNGSRGRSGERVALRGQKGSLYEGGTRVPAFLHSARYQRKHYRCPRVLVELCNFV